MNFILITSEVIEDQKTVRRNGKGRSPKGYIPEFKTIYQIKCSIGELVTSLKQRAMEQASCFVLISNKLDKSPQDILKEYKQQTTVEVSFRFLKSPVFLDAVYLKKESRIEALCYALFLALFIYQILQRRVRNALEAKGEYVTIAGNVKTEKTTGNRILELLKPIQTIGYIEGNKEYRVVPDIPNKEPLDRILSLARLTPDIYTIIRKRPHNLSSSAMCCWGIKTAILYYQKEIKKGFYNIHLPFTRYNRVFVYFNKQLFKLIKILLPLGGK